MQMIGMNESTKIHIEDNELTAVVKIDLNNGGSRIVFNMDVKK
jgi:hypothetical protein